MNGNSHSQSTQATDLAASALIAVVGLLCVFLAAYATRDWALFSLIPPQGGSPDVMPQHREDLHRTFFTVWASLILAAPAIALLPLSGRSAAAARGWRILWTASMLIFMVHFYWAVMVIFDGDWTRVLHTPRVSAPRLDTLFAVWWWVDVCLAWTVSPRALWVRCQRVGVHVLAVVLFFMGAAREGELLMSKMLGWSFAAVVVAGLVVALVRAKRSVPRG